jgi:tetratricopeptide (TPR) repeat protein
MATSDDTDPVNPVLPPPAEAPARKPWSRPDDTDVLPAVDVAPEPLQIGPCRILGVVARGGMGTVYRAQVVVSCGIAIGSQVAVKLLRHIADSHERIRFAREVGYLQALRHPGIVRVLDAGDHRGQPYLVMQLVDGRPLSELAMRGPMPEDQVVELAIHALEALHTAHLAGILHRDVKPGNIMLASDGAVKLLDFGLAQKLEGQSKLTATGAVVGTPAYMSPEQANGERSELSRRSDIYSLGACCYEMLTGQQPFSAENSVALLRRIIDEPLLPPGKLRPGLSADLETIVLKAMAKHPGDRYATAELMAEDLRRFRGGQRIRGSRPGPLRSWLRTAWFHRRTLATAGLVMFISISIAVLAVRHALLREAAHPVADGGPGGDDAAWVDEVARAATPDGQAGLRFAPYAVLGKGMQIASLPGIRGPVRLDVEFTPGIAAYRIEAMVCDRDVGQGYRLRLTGDAGGDLLALLREDKVVASRPLNALAAGRAVHLRLERNDDTVTASVGDAPPLVFVDLAPIDGAEADGVHIAMPPDAGRLGALRLERQKVGLLVSALAPADLLRQDGRYARAIQGYEAFLRDHPTSPLARDARFRIGLCYEALGDQEQSLAAYLAVARDYRDDPDSRHHVLAALFRAWGCSLRLGRYLEAEQYYEAIRRSHDLATLLASVPEDTLNALIADYFGRAAAAADGEPQRAVKLFRTGTDLAAYLDRADQVAAGTFGAVGVLVATGGYEEACGLLAGLDRENQRPELRAAARLHLGHAERLRGRHEIALRLYRALIDDPGTAELQAQWARLWLGDLYVDLGDRDAARAQWGSSVEDDSLPGRLMHHLLHGTKPLSADDGEAAIVEYVNARLALLRGFDQAYIDRLQNVVRLGPGTTWPVPLARRLLE